MGGQTMFQGGMGIPKDGQSAPSNPYGFTPPSGPAASVMSPFYNAKTGETYTATSGGYTPPSSDWVSGNLPSNFTPSVGQSTAANAIAPVTLASQTPATGGLNSALGTTSTAAPMQASNYDTTGAPTAMPIMGANVSNPNTATLGTGQTTNPFNAATNPYIQAAQATTMGNLYGAQAATQANRINQNTPYGSLNYTQGVDAQGNPTWTANQQLSQPLQDLTSTSLQGLQQSLQNPMYGINPGETYSSAIMQRLQPQIEQSNERLQAQLANQGIVPGTEAYNRAMTLQGQKTNDLLTSAQVQGMNTGLQAQQLQNQQAANIRSLAAPNYINPYSQAAVAGPDYMGAYTTSRAADIAQQNAANARTANLQSGLFGLGSSAILGAGGIGNILGSVGSAANAGTGLLGLGGSAYNWLNSGASSPISYDASGAVINSGISYPLDGGYLTSGGNFIDSLDYSSLF
jgi:hypothetical protein